MRSRFLAALLLFAAVGASAAPNPWPAAVRADLDFIYRAVHENHPGAVDERNGAFGQWLERGYNEAVASAPTVSSETAARNLLERYLAGFADTSLRLEWTPARPAAADLRAQASSSITEVMPKVFWVRLPEFEPNARQAHELRELIDAMEGLRAADTVIFDLRGNRGGAIGWSAGIVDRLYDGDYLDTLHRRAGIPYLEWRTSAGNLAHLKSTAHSYRDTELTRRMELVLREGGALVKQDGLLPNIKKGFPQLRSKARAVVLTDGGCVTACLAFAERALRTADARHVGLTTGADSSYGGVRKLALPGKPATLTIAQSVLRDQRRHNEALVPSSVFPGSMADDAAVRAWVLSTLR